MEKTFQDTGINKDFLQKTPIGQEIISKINTRDYMKLKSFSITKENNHQHKGTASNMGKKSLPPYFT